METDFSFEATIGVVATPALWLPQGTEWSLAALAAAGEALLDGGCPVRVYDADFANLHPLHRALAPRALGGPWSILAAAGRLCWWETPLNAVARGEHALLWLGADNQPPGGWSRLVLRARTRELDYHWLPGNLDFGLPPEPPDSQARLPIPEWLGLRPWDRLPRLPDSLLADWKKGVPPGRQVRETGFWRPKVSARFARQRFAGELDQSLSRV